MIWNEEAQLWIPDDSVKSDKCWRFIKRNTHDLDTGVKFVKKRSVALQAGAHIGIFPNHLAGIFDRVIAFEPDPNLFACFNRNALPNVEAYNFALTSVTGDVKFHGNVSGVGHVADDGKLTVKGFAYDEMDVDVNFIHLDVEGHEVEALRGAASMIEACSPVLQLEILPRFRDGIYDYVQSIGYRVACDTCRDHVFVRAS